MSKRRSGRAKSRRTRASARRAGFKSAFERLVGDWLTRLGVSWEYEPWWIEYVITHRYTPDFELENGILIESKGRFTGKDRTKHLKIREQHPELDIRFVFQRDNYLSPKSKTRYSEWCERYGFEYAIGEVPEEWINE